MKNISVDIFDGRYYVTVKIENEYANEYEAVKEACKMLKREEIRLEGTNSNSRFPR